MENGFQGLEGQIVPDMTDEFVNSVTERYTELFEAMTGKKFKGRDYANAQQDIELNINNTLETL